MSQLPNAPRPGVQFNMARFENDLGSMALRLISMERNVAELMQAFEGLHQQQQQIVQQQQQVVAWINQQIEQHSARAAEVVPATKPSSLHTDIPGPVLQNHPQKGFATVKE